VQHGSECIYCVYLRARHNLDHPDDIWDNCVVYLMKNGLRERSTARKNTKQEPMCRCLTCRFVLCYYHFDRFHDINNEEANLSGPYRAYDNEDEE